MEVWPFKAVQIIASIFPTRCDGSNVVGNCRRHVSEPEAEKTRSNDTKGFSEACVAYSSSTPQEVLPQPRTFLVMFQMVLSF